ncbi:MAG: polysaccharide biosynthesis/export family protein [Pyrinomonadaceae bacterium]|nr:polysaccharide biosynthesis/export family protein [Pyrinomonadaceae bacterium]
MKVVKFYGNVALILASVFVFSAHLSAQTENPPVKSEKTEQPELKNAVVETSKSEVKIPDSKTETQNSSITPKPAETPAPVSQEEAEILPYYNNYLKEYRLGPNDVITVEVFGQCPDYCKTGITVPPTARISYPLIREGVMVGGKTVEQVAAEITKKLDEYIISPNVTVTLDKAMSSRYSVLGKVAAPGVRVLDRKVSVYEAVIESGGITKEGDKKRVVIYSYDGQGRITPKTVNLQDIERGKGEMVFLNPGDQVFVPDRGFRLNINTVFDVLSKASIVRLLFGSPF